MLFYIARSLHAEVVICQLRCCTSRSRSRVLVFCLVFEIIRSQKHLVTCGSTDCTSRRVFKCIISLATKVASTFRLL
jgi:hypothetical protein